MANSTVFNNKRFARAVRLTLLTAACIALGIVANDALDAQVPPAEAETAATLLAQRAAEHWLDDDKLALQTLVRHTESLRYVRYAALFDIAQTPVSESGMSDHISETHLYNAPITIASSEVGHAVIAFQPVMTLSPWWLLGLAPFIGALSLIQSRKHLETANNRVPLSYVIIALKQPAELSEWRKLQDLSLKVSDYYNTEIEQGTGYFCASLYGEEAIDNAFSLARLWYGAYYAEQCKHHQSIDVGVYVSFAPNTDDHDIQHWLFDAVCKAANANGVAIDAELATAPETARIAVIAQEDQSYRLKRLCEQYEQQVKQQLQVLIGE